jgi:NAD(P)-dependent dehydrogenase (short-subunit alcohol dehydrogenase family)
MRDTSRAEALVARGERDGSRIEVVALDVTDDVSVDAAARHILGATDGCVDVVVNNAGIGAFGAVEDSDPAEERRIMETNFWGPVRVVRAFLPAMRARRAGVIVNVSSLSGRVPPTPCLGFYAASKHALGAISQALRYEVARDDIRVVLIEPGSHRTNVEANLPPVDVTSPYADLAARTCQLTVDGVRAGDDPADVADAIVTAAQDSTAPLHIPVGLGAIGAIGHYEAHGVAGWDDAIRDIFGDDVPVR